MRLFKALFILGFLGFVLWGCGGGTGGEGEQFFALTNSPEVVVGGIKGSVSGGAIVLVRNLNTGQEVETIASNEGSFVVTLDGSIGNTIRISAPRVVVAVEVMPLSQVSPEIRQEIMSGAVRRNLVAFEGFPTAIEIRGNRAYVLNFFNRIEIFNLDQNPPQRIGEIGLPPESDPVGIAFLDDTRAYVSDNIGQNVVIVNVQTMECETVITETPGDFRPCINPPILIPEGSFEDPWTGVAITNGKVYVSNFNFDEEGQPLGNGFVTVIDTTTNEVIRTIELSAENAQGITVVGNRVYVVSAGDFSFDEGLTIPVTDGAVDVIDPETDEIVATATIPIRLNPDLPLVGSPNKLEPTSDGKFGYIGSGTAGVLFKVDLENNTLLRGTGVEGTPGPIIVTPASQQGGTFDVEIRDGLAFIASFNTDQIFAMDTENDSINPFPFIAPFPVGQKADDPDSQFLEGPQFLAIRSDGNFPDIFFVTVANSTTLGSINTEPILPPE